MLTIKEQCEAIWRGEIINAVELNIWWTDSDGCVMIDWEAHYGCDH